MKLFSTLKPKKRQHCQEVEVVLDLELILIISFLNYENHYLSVTLSFSFN